MAESKLLYDPNALDPMQVISDAENFRLQYEQDPAETGEPMMLDGIDPVEGDDLGVEPPVNPPGGRDMFLAPMEGNAAQKWQQRQPMLNVRQMAQQNAAALSGSAQTTRFYTRKLLRMAMGSRNPAVAEEARVASRIQGARNDPAQFGMGTPAAAKYVDPNRPLGLTNKDTWRNLFPPAAEARRAGEPLPPPVVGGNWSEIFNQTRANDFGAGTAARPNQTFNPSTGQIEATPPPRSMLNEITQKLLSRAESAVPTPKFPIKSEDKFL